MSVLERLTVTADPASVTAALPVYRDFLDGRRSLLPTGDDAAGDQLAALMGAGDATRPVAPGTLIACTSGSTGTPKGALLRTDGVRAAICASASFIAQRTGHRPGPWLLTLPPHHIAGTMVILRSLDAGADPAVLSAAPFTAHAFAAATQQLASAHPDAPLYTSLVPAQLARLLGDADGEQALARYAAVLIGGGPTPPAAVARCREVGAVALLTYGSSETAGGVLYNGEPLPGYTVTLDDGRVELSGPSVAEGYRMTDTLDPAVSADAFPRPGTFRTSDLGEIHGGVLTVLGRSDGAVNSGGLKILPEQVEAALASVGVTACAVGVPDSHWGEIVAVLVEDATLAPGTDVTADVRARLGTGVARHLVPKLALSTDALPLTGPGKLDRMRVRSMLAG
ncbi:AMP-binding protein [Corynebacterium terpenotabidum]|uniref:O-succinylbenzoic acid-CoA ligase n=1 Tax=Corynebacterium terpenotabidum Y-11 TaxID=1200352 RepID=S4XIS0_9CORY|nr:AMP-binding protein [Corynebacterium terpenotabidum]AGP31645.1 O-succinylbenzoic acid-CoA ligase [Corynebacterium terpenotabidum Y-11]